MNVQDAIRSRTSCRLFLDKPVDRELLREVCHLGLEAPSGLNLQPWLITVVSGAELPRLSRKLKKAARERLVKCAPEAESPLAEVYAERRQALNRTMGPAIRATPTDWPDYINDGSLEFYRAPAAVVVSGEAALAHQARLDVGILVGYLLLAARAKGLATCPIGLVTAYDHVIRDFLNLGPDRPVLLALAVGYADEEAPVNRVKVGRASPKQVLRWYG